MAEEAVSKPRRLCKAALALLFVAACSALQGCEDYYRDTCVWHSDLNIKGCSYYGYRGCIQHCHYCINSNGPDECAQLKCASFCAARESGDCVRNYEALCNIALEEGFKANTSTGSTYYTCDVRCSSARAASVALPLALTFAASSGIPKRFLILGGVLAWMTSLQGCGCTHPTPHLSWRPDSSVFNERTGRMVDGIWRGNPSWVWSPELESEDYQCVAMHPTHDICVSWTSHEWNCGEHDFGMCKCYQLAANNRYCEKWSCHSLEADQEVCHHSSNSEGGSEEECTYAPFPMNYQVYNQLMEQQASGMLTTGENFNHWWRPTSLWSADIGRRLGEEELLHKPEEEILSDYLGYLRKHNASELDRLQKSGGITEPRQLANTLAWPPVYAYSPASRHIHFWWGDVCIVNGDNTMIAKRHCHRWREIETEIQMCECRSEAAGGASCSRWVCEDRDVGLFSVLFRTTQSIDQYTEGVEFESYTCTRTNVDGECVAWQGDIASLEEVEWSSCEASDASLNRLGAVWLCDEWELPKTRDLFFESNIGIIFAFIGLEIFIVICLCRSMSDDDGDALLLTTCLSWTVGLCLLPFLVVTLGLYGFLFAGGLFWAGRLCCCGALCLVNMRLPEWKREEQPSNKVRLQRGASKILGRQASSVMPSPKVPPEETANETNETNETNQNNEIA